MPKLQKLTITNSIGSQEINLKNLTRKVYFEDLEFLELGALSYDYQEFRSFILSITEYAPKIKTVKYIESKLEIIDDVISGRLQYATQSYDLFIGNIKLGIRPH